MPSINQSLKINAIIDQRPLSRFQSITIMLCALVLVLDGFSAQSIGFLAPSMADSLHLSVRTFGPVFAAALIGLTLSSLIAGPLADRVGRKAPIILSTITFATFSIATARATSFDELVALRFLTGLGLGGAIPNVVALTAEYAPKRLQQTLVTILFCGMPLGALLGGLVSSIMLPRWGWQSVFYAGGFLTMIVALVLIKVLPESIRFLALRRSDRGAICKILTHIAPEVSPDEVDFSPSTADRRLEGSPLIHLFAEQRAPGTLLLWTPFFMNLLMLYFIINWLPALLRQTHMPSSAGIVAVSVFSVGGIAGSLLQGRVMRTLGPPAVLIAEFALSLLLIGALAFISSFLIMIVTTFILGCFIQGAQAGLNALSATFYPTSIRSTGIGWALGIGRLGSIVGPLLGGLMISHAWPLRNIFFAGAAPALLAAFAVMMSYTIRGGNPYRPSSSG